MTHFNRDVAVNAVWFYLVWFSAVLGREPFLPLTIVLILCQIYLQRRNHPELILIATVALTGVVIDSLLAATQVFIFQNHFMIPFWLVLLWVGFACTLNHSLMFLSKHWLAASLFGALGGSSSYFAGYKLGAVHFGFNPFLTLGLLAVLWSLLLPLFFLMKRFIFGRFNGED